VKPKAWTHYKTKCGFQVEVYKTTASHYSQSSNNGQAIGAILIPNHPAAFPGWQSCEWNAETGKALGRADGSDDWDLMEEIGPLQPT
jgi:hypothetical protein